MSALYWADARGWSVGDVAFAVERTYVMRRERRVVALQSTPATTNQSNQPRLYGWCGTTDDVSVYADGVARVVRVSAIGRAQCVRLDGADATAALERLGYPELAGD